MAAVSLELDSPTGPAAVLREPARRAGHTGAWRVLITLPAIVGSLFLLLILFGWMGQWEGLVLLGWLASGAAVYTRLGERTAVAVGCGFRRPSRTQLAAVSPVWSAALAQAGIDADDVDLYVQRSGDLNAYAAGGRSVAVTTGVLREFLARRLGSDEMQAALIHDPLTAPVTVMPEMPAL